MIHMYSCKYMYVLNSLFVIVKEKPLDLFSDLHVFHSMACKHNHVYIQIPL